MNPFPLALGWCLMQLPMMVLGVITPHDAGVVCSQVLGFALLYHLVRQHRIKQAMKENK